MQSLLQSQYEMVKDSRNSLLRYCSTLLPIHLIQEVQSFGRGSIRNLLIHSTNTYKFWLIENVLREKVSYVDPQLYYSVDDIIPLYKQVDLLVESFLKIFDNKFETPLTIQRSNGTELTVTPLKLFTHVITHEFHHKGQILSLSRHLGYIPPDTDIIR